MIKVLYAITLIVLIALCIMAGITIIGMYVLILFSDDIGYAITSLVDNLTQPAVKHNRN